MILFKKNEVFEKWNYNLESEFEDDVVANHKLFFGPKTIYIDTKKKITSKELGNTIPDGLLFDFKDPDNPEFYLVEVELYKHDFYSHIFPQITKFFAFYRNYESRRELVEKIYTIISSDKTLEKKFKSLIKDNELYKYLSDTIEASQNILLIIDDEKKELPEIINTYTDTWGKMVKLQIIKKYFRKDEFIFTVDPEFENVEYSLAKDINEISKDNLEISEEFHLDNSNENVKDIYKKFKKMMHKENAELIFNPQKYYISIINKRNVMFLKFRKKKIRLIIMLSENEIRSNVKNYPVKSLSLPVQDFYNGPCAAIDIETTKYLDEVINLTKPLIQKVNEGS